MQQLTIKNLSKKIKNKYIIKNISLYIKTGEIVGLLGPNGSGKTTTFCSILGIVRHDSGSIFINKENIDTLPIYTRAQLGIGFLPQESSIFRQLTVFDNLMAVLQTQHYLNTKQRNTIIINLMKRFNIYHLKKCFGQKLSVGERRRVEIARALAANPKFILLDEPFSGIDPISITNIQNIIIQLKSNKIGILITDHNVQETLRICDRAYIFNKGKTIAHGSPKEIFNNKYVKDIYLGKNINN